MRDPGLQSSGRLLALGIDLNGLDISGTVDVPSAELDALSLDLFSPFRRSDHRMHSQIHCVRETTEDTADDVFDVDTIFIRHL